ncbi:MAG: UDP-glucose/GDP-mannose dehydrogenase family protein [Candidatus Magasanikbacteria bacterium]|nr:UDP-glucose/GDP-mannose dehydrogenase family protein [Candidatus Magasanikbacteria bacterium]
MPTISIVGLGKLGASMVAAYADRGFSVIGVDINEQAVAAINAHTSPVPEAHVTELLQKNAARVRATTDVREAVLWSDITFIIVPTPTDETGGFTPRYVLEACEGIGRAIAEKGAYHLVAVTATLMPGHSIGLVIPALERASGKTCGKDFGYCYNPEFIAIGTVVRDLLNPDFILIGESDKKAGDALNTFYTQALGWLTRVKRMNPTSAEIAKLSLNVFVTMKISFANSLAELCEQYPGADVDAVTDAIGTDSRIGKKYLKAGVGFGGTCFPRDNRAFATLVKAGSGVVLHSPVTDAINERNKQKIAALVLRASEGGKRVGILGLAYKPGTNVVEESHGVYVAQACLAAGRAVSVFDPAGYDHARKVLGDGVMYCATLEECVGNSDVALVVNMDPAFEILPTLVHDGQTVIDPWRMFRDKLDQSIKYVTLGLGKSD